MEDILMGDDSSSGESDEEVPVNVPAGGTVAAAVAAIAAPVPAVASPPPVVAVTAAASTGNTTSGSGQQLQGAAGSSSGGNGSGGGSGSQPDQMARLKSLYQSQPKRSTPTPGPPQAQQLPPQPQQLPPSQQVQQQQQQQQQQHLLQQPSGARPLMPNRPHNLPHQHQQKHQMPTPQQVPQTGAPPQQQQQQQQYHPQHSRQSNAGSHRSSSTGQHHSHASSHPTPAGVAIPPSGVPDPFAPTPLHRIKERHQQKLNMHHQVPPQSQQQKQQLQQQQQHRPHQIIPQQQLYNRVPPQQQQQQQQQQQPQLLGQQVPPPHLPSQQPPQQRGSSSIPNDRAAMERELRRQKEKFLMFTRVLIKYLEQKDPNMHKQAKLIIKDCADRNRRQERGYESVTAAMKERLKALVGEAYWKRAEAYLKHFLEQKKAQTSSATNSGGGAVGIGAGAGGGTTGSSSAPRGGGPVSAINSSNNHKAQQMQEAQRKLQLAKLGKDKQQQAAAAATTPAPTTLQQVQREIATQKAKVASAAKSGGAGGKGTSMGGKKAAKKKPSAGASSRGKSATARDSGATTPTPSAAQLKAAAVVQDPVDPESLPPREYNELMELIDHASDYDWKTAGLLFGSKMDLQLNEEQHNLLYGESMGAAALKDKEPAASSTGPRAGWGTRNVVSSRTAWAAVRLREYKLQQLQQQASPQPVIGDIGLTLPRAPHGAADNSTPSNEGSSPSKTSITKGSDNIAWVNEETAEQDTTLAMLSEGAQIYLKGILEKAIQCARQRQNLDGIRLWHQQHAHIINNNTSKNTTTDTNKIPDDNGHDEEENRKKGKPPLSLRLGCDVPRQQAQAAGNAAMVVKRLEQALERQSGVPSRARVLRGETLVEANSMADLALRPQLAKGAEMADLHGKRRFEIYGGKEAMEPPLGRVPKQAKLEVIDFLMGSQVMEPFGRHQASNAAASIYF